MEFDCPRGCRNFGKCVPATDKRVAGRDAFSHSLRLRGRLVWNIRLSTSPALIYLLATHRAFDFVAVFGCFLYFKRRAGEHVTMIDKAIFVLLIVLLGGGWYGRGRWYGRRGL